MQRDINPFLAHGATDVTRGQGAGQTRGEKASGADCGVSVCVAVLVTVTITVTVTVTVTVIVIVTACEAMRRPWVLGGAAEGRARRVEERINTNRSK